MAPNQGYVLIRHESALDSTEIRRQTIAKCAILFVLILERLAFYALVASFFLFLNEGPWNKLDSWDSIEALTAVFVLLGVSYISAPIGGYISDAWLGRFKSIILGFALYIIGYVLLTLMSVDALPHYICNLEQLHGFLNVLQPLPHAPCKGMVYISILILAIGVGIIKSNIAPFGAEQLNNGNSKKIRAFFNWFYWCTNIGSIIGIGAISFIEQDNPGFCTNGFFCGYVISTGCLCLALLVFVAAYPWYQIFPPEGSAIVSIFKIFWQGIKAQCRHWRYNRLNPALSPLHVEPSCLDRAKIRYGGSFHEGTVDDVRALGKMMALFMVFIPYWLVYLQMETTFQAQGLHMRFAGVYKNSSLEFIQPKWKFSVPAAWLTLFNQIFLILAIPLLSTFLYPFFDRSGVRISLLFRIGLGMVFSTLAVLTAGGLETYRILLWRTDNSTHIDQVIRNVTYHAVDISIFWQVPQYTLVGAAEAFTTIAGMEYAYSAAPSTFQGLIMGLFYSMNGIASFLGTGLIYLVAPFWFNNTTDFGNINDNHLDFYLYFLACIQVTTLIIYGVVLYIRRFSLHLVTMPRPLSRRRERHPPEGASASPVEDDGGHSGFAEEEQQAEGGARAAPSLPFC